MVKFWKFQGAENDFIVVDREGGALLSPEVVTELCHRHRGIGADGVLSVKRGTLSPVEMVVQNSDGSLAGMCGNGLRCVLDALWRGYFPWVEFDRQASLEVQVGERIFVGSAAGDGRFNVDMGKPTFEHPHLPQHPRDERLTLKVEDGRTFDGWLAHYGNPHFVTFVSENPLDLAQRYGSELESHGAFPDRANISFVRVSDDKLDAVVFERGVGITQACGTGACAIATAAIRAGHRAFNEPIEVVLPGGELKITIDETYSTTMNGPSTEVFCGEVTGV